MPFEPVRTRVDLQSLDEKDIVEGYMSAERGDPEPGENRGRAFWHGWRNRMMDLGVIPLDDASRQLVREVLQAGLDVARKVRAHGQSAPKEAK